MRTFLVDRVIDSEQSEGAIVPIVHIHSQYDQVQEKFYVETTVESLEFETLASGQIITVIYVKPVDIGEKLITGIYEYVDFCPILKAGDRLLLYYSSREEEHRGNYRYYEPCLEGDFAAYLSDYSEPHFRRLSRPHKCPKCQSHLFRAEDNVLRCYNFSCPASLAVSILNWRAWAARKDTLEFINYRFAAQLIESGLVTSIADLYRLTFEQLTGSFQLTKNQAKNMLFALEYSKRHPWSWLLKRLCTRTVGYRARRLAEEFSSFEEIAHANLYRLVEIEDFSRATAQSVHFWFKTSANRHLVRQLQEVGLKTSVPLKAKDEDSQQLFNTIQQNIIKPITDSLSALWKEFRDKLQNDERKFSHYDETFEKIENQLNQYEKLLLEKFDQLLKRTDLEAIIKNLSERQEDSLLRRSLNDLTEQYDQIQLDLQAIRAVLENSIQEALDDPLTSEEFKKYQTQEAKRQQSQFFQIEKTLDKQLEETRRELQQFVTSSVQKGTEEPVKASDLEVILQLIDEVPSKIETQLKLDSKLKSTSNELDRFTKELTSCKNSLQKQIADLAVQILLELETFQARQNESSQAILDRFQTQNETLLDVIQVQQTEILPHFGTLQQQLAVISEQNDRLNEQFSTEQIQFKLKWQNLQDRNNCLQTEIQQSLKEQCTLAEKLSERSQLLEEKNYELTTLTQTLSPSIESLRDELADFQPDNTSPETLSIFRQLAAQIHQANEQLQAIRPVAAPLINELRQENVELRMQVQQAEEERDRSQESLSCTNEELNQARFIIDRLSQEKSSLEQNLSDTQSQLRIAREQQATSQNELNRLSTELHKQLHQAMLDVAILNLEKSDNERQLADTRSQLEKAQNRQLALEGEIDRLTTDLRRARVDLGQLERENLQLRNHLTRTQVLYEQAQQHLQECRETRRNLEEQLEAAKAKLSQTKSELQFTQKGLQGFINRGFSRDRQARG